MTIIRSTFERAGELYGHWFADWLHVHFLIRTVLLLLALWLIIYVLAQLFQYVLWPLALMFFYHVIFRAWNFLFVETPQEWLYIRYHSKDRPNFAALYMRLCDKVKKNRMVLSHTRFSGMVRRARRAGARLTVICSVAATLWVTAFGLHQEYAAPALAVIDEQDTNEAAPDETDGEPDGPGPAEPPRVPYSPNGPAESPAVYGPGGLSPAAWPPGADIILALNEQGSQGARLRDGPGITGHTVIEILWDSDRLLYLHAYVPDPYVDGLYWLRVRSLAGTDGYISSQLVDVVGQFPA